MGDTRFTLSLRITHPARTPNQLAEALGLTPQISNSVGEPRRTPKGEALDGTYRRTYCAFRLIEQQSGPFTDGIRTALDKLMPHKSYLLEVAETGGRSEFYEGVFVDDGTTTGFILDPELTARLGQFQLDLAVDVYWD